MSYLEPEEVFDLRAGDHGRNSVRKTNHHGAGNIFHRATQASSAKQDQQDSSNSQYR